VKVLVTEPLSESGLDLLRGELDVDVRPELAKEGLADAIAGYHALIIRSATKVTADVFDRADELRVVGRAGIGLDNVDVEAATRRGVMVVNAPEANILSAAEHTMALLLAQARNIPQAHASLKAGRWERSKFEGVELHGKTLGILGLGRVGAMVAARAQAFGMRLVGYDPYVSRERAKSMGVELMPSDITSAITAQNTQVAAGQIGGQPSPDIQMLNATVTARSRRAGGAVTDSSCASTLNPSASGSVRSSSNTSGGRAIPAFTASLTVSATSTSYPLDSNSIRRALEMSVLSSTTRTRIPTTQRPSHTAA